jgi:hypothetical protein
MDGKARITATSIHRNIATHKTKTSLISFLENNVFCNHPIAAMEPQCRSPRWTVALKMARGGFDR